MKFNKEVAIASLLGYFITTSFLNIAYRHNYPTALIFTIAGLFLSLIYGFLFSEDDRDDRRVSNGTGK